MRKTIGNTAKFIIFLAIGIFLVWFITHNLTAEQWQRIKIAFREANYWILIPVFIFGGLSHLLRALRWRLLIQPLGYQPRVITTFSAVMIGYLANLAIPRMGEITRCGVLSRHERIPVNKVIGTMIAERAIDILCLALFITVTILIQVDLVGNFFYSHIWLKISSVFTGHGLLNTILFVLAIIVVLAGLWFFLKLFKQALWYQKLQLLLKGIQEGLFTTIKLKKKQLFFIYTVLIWFCYLMMAYVGFWCFQATSGLGIKAAMSVLSFGSIGMIVTQGGIGAYQLIVEKTLELYGILEAYGFAFSWLSWLAQTALSVVLGFICLLVMSFIKRQEAENQLPSTNVEANY